MVKTGLLIYTLNQTTASGFAELHVRRITLSIVLLLLVLLTTLVVGFLVGEKSVFFSAPLVYLRIHARG